MGIVQLPVGRLLGDTTGKSAVRQGCVGGCVTVRPCKCCLRSRERTGLLGVVRGADRIRSVTRGLKSLNRS